ncbi:MauE/DoxX family redox-associated membrane protein [Eudoraea chungangensis]|uniref:MauE/DoxX family redox-associated membrane protein n=1 Tax=Eudoraea chungangensis TaxID=1481905 RepID=UPI0023EE1AC4|nr:MauE/DoxX family redox-associated membrane protein [Eudoraea chungangensis]
MNTSYTINGMTCDSCVRSVTEKILSVVGVSSVEVSLANSLLEFESEEKIPIELLQNVLGTKYILETGKTAEANKTSSFQEEERESKWKQLRPLFLIFTYLTVATFLLNRDNWQLDSAMYDFMGLFYIVFSFFKFLDLRGFPKSFRMYDPLAKRLPIYGSIYPFVELVLGLFFLMRWNLLIAVIATIIILGITTFGVAKSLFDKKSIHCACLGTVLKLPMTEATIVENVIMLLMACYMLFSNYLFLWT